MQPNSCVGSVAEVWLAEAYLMSRVEDGGSGFDSIKVLEKKVVNLLEIGKSPCSFLSYAEIR